jgi:hypothetical protein
VTGVSPLGALDPPAGVPCLVLDGGHLHALSSPNRARPRPDSARWHDPVRLFVHPRRGDPRTTEAPSTEASGRTT